MADEISANVREGLSRKVEDHNKEHGDTASKRVTQRMLEGVFRRGVGAYRTNPSSVRPGVSSPDQWAYARVNSFLQAVRSGDFRSGQHDTDLLPAGHPKSTRKAAMEKAEYQGRDVELDKPFRLPSGSNAKFCVYVRDGDSVKRVTFGSPDMEIRRDDPEARANFRARHSCDTATDKTSARYWSCRMWDDDVSVSEMLDKVEIAGEILKADDEQRMVYGWASVITEGGKPVVDKHGDIIEVDELERAATEFMKSARVAKAMHDGPQIGEVVHSFPITKQMAESLGLATDREGWIVGMHVPDDSAWSKVKDGTYRAFSFGGSGERVKVD